MELKNLGRPKNAYGLYLTINADFEQMINVVRTSDAEHKAEIAIDYHGRVREYSLHEFLNKLGFEVEI